MKHYVSTQQTFAYLRTACDYEVVICCHFLLRIPVKLLYNALFDFACVFNVCNLYVFNHL